MNIQEAKDNAAIEAGFEKFEDIMHRIGRPQIVEIMERAMQLYAESKCKEQRIACADSAKIKYVNQDNIEHIEKSLYTSAKTLINVYKESILQTPLATDKP